MATTELSKLDIALFEFGKVDDMNFFAKKITNY